DLLRLHQFFDRKPVFASMRAHLVDNRGGNVVEGLGAARTAVENPRCTGVIQKMQIDVYDIVDIDEVPHLTTILVAIPASEKAYMPFLQELLHVVERYGSHAPLMLFPWSVHVEIAQPDHRRRQRVQA